MAKLDLALVVRTVDQATRPLRRIQQSVRQVARSTGLDRVGRQVRVVGRQMRTVGDEAGRFGRRVALGIGAAVGGAVFFTQRYATVADLAQKMADRIGIGVEEMQRLSHAFDLGGVAVGQSQRAMLYFTARIGEATRGTGEAADMFKAMGIAIKTADGEVKTSGDLFYEVADAMHQQESPAKRAYAAQILFGRAGRQMVKVLSEGSDMIKEHGDAMDQYRIISEQEGRAAEEYIDNQLRMKQAIQGVQHAIGAELIPKLSEATVKIKEWITENNPRIVRTFLDGVDDLAEAFGWLSWGIRQTLDTLGGFIAKIRETFEPADKAIGWLIDFAAELGWAKVAVIVLGAWLAKGLLFAVIGLFAPLAGLIWWIGVAGLSMLWMIAKPIAMLIAALAGPLVKRVIPAAITAFRALWAAALLPAIVAAAVAAPLIAAIAAIVAAVGVAAYLIYAYWDDIVVYAKKAWATFVATFSDEAILAGLKLTFASLTAWLNKQSWFVIGQDWVGSLWMGMKSEYQKLKRWFDETFWFLSDQGIMRLFGLGGAQPEAGERQEGGGASTFAAPSPGVPMRPIPSLTAPTADPVPGADRRRLRHGGRAQVTVDFKNMPRGTRTETRGDADTDLEVNTGYAMQGAF